MNIENQKKVFTSFKDIKDIEPKKTVVPEQEDTGEQLIQKDNSDSVLIKNQRTATGLSPTSMGSFEKRQLRIECVRIASQRSADAKSIVSEATIMYDFITGGTNE